MCFNFYPETGSWLLSECLSYLSHMFLPKSIHVAGWCPHNGKSWIHHWKQLRLRDLAQGWHVCRVWQVQLMVELYGAFCGMCACAVLRMDDLCGLWTLCCHVFFEVLLNILLIFDENHKYRKRNCHSGTDVEIVLHLVFDSSTLLNFTQPRDFFKPLWKPWY